MVRCHFWEDFGGYSCYGLVVVDMCTWISGTFM